MSPNTTINNTISTSQQCQCVKMTPLQHKKKKPKQWFIPSFGPQYVCYECNITTMATNGHHGQWTGAQNRSWAPHVFFFSSFFFLTNVNFELNRLCHGHLTPPLATPQQVDHINARWHPTAKKVPKWQFIPSFGLQCVCHITTMATNHHHGQQTGARDLSWAPHVCFFPSFFLFFYANMNFLMK